MSRKPREVDIEEVREIVMLKLKELGGIKKKLTYNSVFEFNKKIANNPEYKRTNEELFRLYGYDFWAHNYKGVDYDGKKIIDEIKNSDIKVVGEEFESDIQDIITLVNDFYKKPDYLIKRLHSVFDRDRTKNKRLVEENNKLKAKNELLSKKIEAFEKGLTTLFYNSEKANNSLENVIAMTNSRDSAIYKELRNMFSDDESRLNMVIKIDESKPKANEPKNNILNFKETKEDREKRRNKYKDDL